MKKTLLTILFITFALGLSAQKEARKAVRSGNKAYKEQLYGTAQGEYEKALGHDASSKEASYNLANTYYKQQRWDDALKEYDHYLTLEKDNPEKMSAAWSNVGNTYLKKKANEKSQAQAMQNQGQQPQQGGQQTDHLKLSMEAYKNALRLNPTDDETRYNLAVVQKMIQDRQNEDQNQNQDKQQDQDKQDKQDQQDKQQDPKQDKKDQQQDENQMSQDNMQQILQAIEQDEKATQERVQQRKAAEQKQKNENNRRQNKDW
ncbi:tetratricopeptide repeat protein [Dysgonomonas sp. 511]|uniref:tetratricopeptide repeat protein n=1 Tax=Dysgonomonas sp. 511 TaxID=2302930 RepID=UPI0013D4CB55|nr:tetratricopeptide repeat protein [Dysgonomonas sp. 511]NDV78887.1 tetratricopeptide repeat protein [Dysgonomonas sp. 511]